jgi:hypothetical protein
MFSLTAAGTPHSIQSKLLAYRRRDVIGGLRASSLTVLVICLPSVPPSDQCLARQHAELFQKNQLGFIRAA